MLLTAWLRSLRSPLYDINGVGLRSYIAPGRGINCTVEILKQSHKLCFITGIRLIAH